MHVRISWKLSLSPLADIWAALLSCSWWKSLCSPKYLRGVGENPWPFSTQTKCRPWAQTKCFTPDCHRFGEVTPTRLDRKIFCLSFSCCCCSSTTLIVNAEDNMWEPAATFWHVCQLIWAGMSGILMLRVTTNPYHVVLCHWLCPSLHSKTFQNLAVSVRDVWGGPHSSVAGKSLSTQGLCGLWSAPKGIPLCTSLLVLGDISAFHRLSCWSKK